MNRYTAMAIFGALVYLFALAEIKALDDAVLAKIEKQRSSAEYQ